MTTRKLRTAPLIAAVTVIVAAGCATPGPALSAPELTDVTVAAIPTADLASLYIAQDEGMFARQGLHVTIEKIPSTAAVIAGQLKGQVDIAAGAYIAYFSAEAAGARFRILAEASTLEPNTRVLATTADSGITTISDLAGKTIGVNGTDSIGTLLINTLLLQNGISPRKVHLVTDEQGFPSLPGKLQAGQYDAVFLAEPYATLAEENYGDQVLTDFYQGYLINLPIDGYIATQAWAQKNPKTAAAFVRAIEEGQALANADRQAVQTAMAKYDNLPPVVTDVMTLPQYPLAPVVQSRLQSEAMLMLDLGMLGKQYTTEVERGTLVASMLGHLS